MSRKYSDIPILATSGRHNSAMMTDRCILTAIINLYGMSSFHFYRWNQLKLIPLPPDSKHEN